MAFPKGLWNRISESYEEIIDHPFNRELAQGTLPAEKFKFYIQQDALYFVDFARALATVGATVKVGQQIGEVESTKTTSTIYTPVSGTVTKINTDLKDHPEVVNSDPYGKGWMAVIELSSPADVDQLARDFGSMAIEVTGS